ncbi:hypothetical protein HNY73_004404 [Argiope bruennichi]|uniref:Uncharacterized protein n=1 Tax=Argiope bruennichi TaxID=94029 RepID=A0A8T0FRD0_ARGBR|nr:hypothetical protein HNY73_004404 [Argiope bruennichi]
MVKKSKRMVSLLNIDSQSTALNAMRLLELDINEFVMDVNELSSRTIFMVFLQSQSSVPSKMNLESSSIGIDLLAY